ncbi:hypothetical protein LIA77_10811 [Sarocladium implicatum]|nr:hypothetical protein LIA77_10811 [Sarocladium implicatum]
MSVEDDAGSGHGEAQHSASGGLGQPTLPTTMTSGWPSRIDTTAVSLIGANSCRNRRGTKIKGLDYARGESLCFWRRAKQGSQLSLSRLRAASPF